MTYEPDKTGNTGNNPDAKLEAPTAIEVVELLVKDALMRGRISPNTARQVMFGVVQGDRR